MKTCKTGCGGKMKVGGTIKKMSKGGSTDLVGMPKYGNNPNTQEGRMLKKGGAVNKKMKSGGASQPCPKGYHWDGMLCRENILHTLSSKLGVGTFLAGATGIGAKRIADKLKEKKAAKEAEKKKKETATPKGKLGMTVGVTNRAVSAGCRGGMVKDASGKCVNERKFKSGGSLKPVPADKVGLAKLPTAVRNKMGFQKKGGSVKRK
jgi:hypothetical protein